MYFGIFAVRYVLSGAPTFSRSQLIFFAVCGFASHLLLFGLVFSTFKVADGISQRISESRRLAVIVRSALIALVLALILRKVVFVAVSFTGGVADFAAFALSASFVAYAATSLLRFGGLGSASEVSHYTLTLRRLFRRRLLRWVPLAVFSSGVCLFAYFTLVYLQGADWQGLLQKISVISVWIATFAVFRAIRQPRPAKRYSLAALLLVLLAGPVLYGAIQLGRPTITRTLQQHVPSFALLIEQYADYDPSFGVTGEILAPATIVVLEGTVEDPFFAMLRQNTNIPPEVRVEPTDIKLVEEVKTSSASKPHIFVFVVDSLRQDYLSPYNRAVRFTPAIESFARESVVMRNAFTRYGGTALAIPSIWTGGMQPHKQFVQPFYPMNSLQKLVDAEHYRALMTIDPVLKSILRPSTEIIELDKGIDWKNYDLAQTLSELKEKLSNKQMLEQPIFVYSQSQNVHQVSLKLNKRPPSVKTKYHGFEPQRAFEVERLDDAFGDFVQFLKAAGIYDESIIILTSDHGDSLGEEGHWGHGNAIYPPVIRIPLIIHIPKSLKPTVVSDPDIVAFSTDITPTLYYLLGHRPVVNNQMLGRPLFTAKLEEQQAYLRDSYLIADSYGPVYGILRDQGRTLFVADAGRNKAYLYDLTQGYGGKRISISEELAAEYKNEITLELKQIQAFYNFHPAQQMANAQSRKSSIAQLYSLLFSN